MAHSHSHNDQSYYTEQLCTIGVCGALGGVAVMLYERDLLKYMLHPRFHIWVLWGGIALLVLVAIRALALWMAVGKAAPAHAHSHDHEHCDHEHHDCDHEHDHDHAHEHAHNHSHDHDHDHSWAPIRYVVLLLPIVLYFLDLPNSGFSISRAHGFNADIDESKIALDDKGFDPTLGFRELEGVAYDKMRRGYYEGKTVKLKGQFSPSPTGNANMFTLVRFKINCCTADAIPLNVVILVDDSKIKDGPPEERQLNAAHLQGKWVEVTGQVQFRERRDRPGEWVTLLLVQPTKDKPLSQKIEQVPPDSNPYL
jgi:hypothetical protein